MSELASRTDQPGRAPRPNHSVERAIELLTLIAGKPAALSQLADALGVHKSTVLRTMQTLEDAGFARRDELGRYSVGTRMIELAFRTLEEIDIRELAGTHLSTLSEVCGQTIHLAIRVDTDVVYIDKREATTPVRMFSQLGRHLPLHCTALGKSMLAFGPPRISEQLLSTIELIPMTEHTIITRQELEADLARARERGFSYDDSENEISVHCIGAPIFSTSGRVDAAVSISVPRAYFSRDDLFALAPALRSTADAISRTIGGRP